MIPLHDDIPSQRLPLFSWSFILLNVLIAALSLTFSDADLTAWCVVPARLLDGMLHGRPDEALTLFSSMFLHAGVMHLVGNMWFLHLFGDNVEDRLGPVGFLAFYFTAGLAGGLLQVAMDPTSPIPMLGASGAISGVLGAYVLWFPQSRITTLFFLGFFARTFRVPAVVFVGFWFLQNLLGLFVGEGGTAWGAHIGGFLVGIVVGVLGLRPRRPPRRHLRDATWE